MSTRTARPLPVYLARTLEVLAVRPPRPGEAVIAHVTHDDACLLLGGFGACTCAPAIRIDREGQRG